MKFLKDNWLVILVVIIGIIGWGGGLFGGLFQDNTAYDALQEQYDKDLKESEERREGIKFSYDSIVEVDSSRVRVIDSLNLVVTKSEKNEEEMGRRYDAMRHAINTQSRIERNSFFTKELTRPGDE